METQKQPSGRVKRQPVGQRNRLDVKGKDENYVYRFVNDVGDRIGQFQEAGYEMVDKKSHKVGDNRVDVHSAEGSQAFVTVGVKPNGEPQKGYLMRIKREWYDEDQAAKMDKVRELETSIKKPNFDGSYGDIKLSRE
jgi:hypothetical protein